MFSVVTDNMASHRYQKLLIEKLMSAMSNTKRSIIGFPGDSREEQIFYNDTKDFWFCSSTDLPVENRYWNAFGIENPETKGNLNIAVEINIPYNHDRRIAGVFLVDREHNIYVAHRGKLRGGRLGIGKKLFFEKYNGRIISAEDDVIDSPIAIISDINDPKLVLNIKNFVHEMVRIKSLR